MRLFISLIFSLILYSNINAQEYMAIAQKGNNWGIINQQGKWVIEPKYQHKPNHFINEMAIVRVDKSFGAVNLEGKEIIKPQYLDLTDFDKNGFARAEIFVKRENNKGEMEDVKEWIFINKKGEQLGNRSYKKLWAFNNGIAIADDGERKIYLNTKGEPVQVKYNNISIDVSLNEFQNKRATIKIEDKIGYIDSTCNVVIKPQFEVAKDFEYNQALIRDKGKWGVIDLNGNYIIEPLYDKITDIEEGYRLFIKNDKTGVIDTNGKIIISTEFTAIKRVDNSKWLVYKGRPDGIMDNDGTYYTLPEKLDDIYKYEEGYAMARSKGKMGLINNIGEWVIEPKYNEMKPIKGGVALGLLDKLETWVYVTPEGKEINIEGANTQRDLGDFSEGLAAVRLNGKIGFIDKTGSWIIEPKFEPITFSHGKYEFTNGIATVKTGDLFGCIDKKGNWVISPSLTKIEPFVEIKVPGVIKKIEELGKNSIKGFFKFKKLDTENIEGITVYLVNDDGEIMYTTKTDKNGQFAFKNLDPDQNYFVKMDATENSYEMVILNAQTDEVITVLSNDKSGMFNYKKLTYEEIGGLSMLFSPDAEMQMGQLTKMFNGQFRYKYLEQETLGGLTVHLIDDNGKIIYTTTTDDQGMFSFKNLPFDKNYIVKMDEPDFDIELLAINDKGILAEMNMNDKGEFVFVKLANITANALSLQRESDVAAFYTSNGSVKARFKYKYLDKYLIKKTITINDKDGDMLAAGITDENGQIYFDGWSTGSSVNFEIHNNENDTNTIEMELINFNSEVIAVVSNKNETFSYTFLEGDIPENPALLFVEDGNMMINEGDVIVKQITDDVFVIYFGFDAVDYNFQGKEQLDKLLQTLKSNKNLSIDITAYSDKTGTTEYNKNLSIKRAQSVANYLLENSVQKNRITTRGLGATNFAIDCDECSEQDHQLNRRAVLKIN